MAQLDDFKENNINEDRVDGSEDYITEVWEDDKGINDQSECDNPGKEAETVVPELDVNDLAKTEVVEDDEVELSS